MLVLLALAGCSHSSTVRPMGPPSSPEQHWCDLALITPPDVAVRGWQPQNADHLLAVDGAPPEIRPQVEHLRSLMRTGGTTPPGTRPDLWSPEALEMAVQVDEWVMAHCSDPDRPALIKRCQPAGPPFPDCPRHPTTTTR